jgi:transcriptional regulator with GAF, ATPase, and Fis domain
MNNVNAGNPTTDAPHETNMARERSSLAEGLNAFLNSGEEVTLKEVRTETEIFAILHALRRTQWNRKQAARLLEISYRGLLYKIRRHNLKPQ